MARRSAVPLAALSLVVIAASGCQRCSAAPHSLEAIRARGVLTVLTRNAPTTYYIGRDGEPTGPEFEMATAFAASIGVKAKFVVEGSVGELLAALRRGDGDMIAAGMTHTEARSDEFGFGPAYQRVTQQVVCRRGGKQAGSVAELAKTDFEVIASSSYVERLRTLRKTHPALRWKTARDADTEALLQAVWEGRLDCTAADSDIFAVNRRYYPSLVASFDLDAPQNLAWVVPRGTPRLQAAMRRWLARYRASGKLARTMQEFYGPSEIFDYVDTRAYLRRIRLVYPKYAVDFRRSADRHDLPPLVLAAQAYQESHWNPHARSPTGVRGMMMLTLRTARSVGVENRLNARASIAGGARYLARLRRRLGDSIRGSDRIWFALAAYNLGFAHLEDARALARRLGRNPDTWAGIRTVLPLLAEERYYRNLPHGYARGTEPVRYVRRIRYYADILRHKTGGAKVTAGVTAGRGSTPERRRTPAPTPAAVAATGGETLSD